MSIEGNLKSYDDAERQLENKDSFRNYFIGAVSSYVEHENWIRAIESAMESYKTLNATPSDPDLTSEPFESID